jgi:acylpyruvate hydrolase
MRLATLRDGDGATCAAVVDDEQVARIAGADGRPAFADVGALLAAGEAGRERAAAALAGGEREPLDPARLARPVLAPGAIVCVGLNYRSHILEMGRDLPEHPTLFAKLARSLVDPYADVVLPRASQQLGYEGELAIVIGSEARELPRERAWEAVGGLTLLNDVTARDWQWRTRQWFAGKTFEATSPLGPWVVTPDELGDLGARELRTTVNGELRQHASLGDLLFGVEDLVADVSRIVTLAPGDVIATGTPGGVGHAQEPSAHLAPGDVVEVAIDGVGALRTRFVEAA